MSFTRWLQNLRSALTPSPVERKPPRTGSHRPHLELLEDRCLLSFSPVASYPAGANPQAVLTADFNGDGTLDIAVANYDDAGTVSVLSGNADGTFEPAVTSATGSSPVSLAVGDFNGDGKLDLVNANSNTNAVGSYDVSVLLGNGDGTFAVPTSVPVNTVSNPTSVAVGDFNADGNLDLGVTSNIYNAGTPPTPGTPGYWVHHPRQFFNPYPPGTVQDWTPTYGYDVYYPGTYGTPGTPAYYDGRVNVLLGHGDGSFSESPNTTSLGFGNHASASVVVGDFNADGKLDLGVTSNGLAGGSWGYWGGYYPGYNVSYANVVLGNGDGSFSAPNSSLLGNSYRTSAAVADFNGDTIPDFASANEDNGTVTVLLGDGSGFFNGPTEFSAGNCPLSVAAGDLNRDGHVDLVTANLYGDTVSVLLGNGDGTFQLARDFAAGANPQFVTLGDFNGDLFPDVAVAASDISVLLNDGIWHSLGVSSFPSSATAGEAHTITVTALNNSDVFTGYTGTVHFSSSDGQADIPADYTFTAGDHGAHTFTVTLKTAGTQSLAVMDTTAPDLSARQEGIVVNPAAASTFVVTSFRSGQFNSQPFVSAYSGGLTTATWTAFGPDGNFYVSSYGTNQVLRYRPDGAFLDVFVNSGNGLVNPGFIAFRGNYLYVTGIGSGGIFRYDASTGAFVDRFVSGASLPENFDWGPDGNLYVAARGTNTVKRYDAITGAFLNDFVTTNLNGPLGLKFYTDGKLYVSNYLANTVTRYNGSTGAFIDTFITAGSGGLTGPHQVVFATDGSLYVASAETDQVLRYDGASGAFMGVAAVGGGMDRPVSLLFGPDGTLYVGGFYSSNVIRYFPSGGPVGTVPVGTADSFGVRATDAYGNLATNYTGTVHFTSTDPLATLPADYAFIAADHGTHTFSATFWTAGMQSLTATATDTAGVTGTLGNIEVTTASRFLVSGFPSSTTAGAAGNFSVAAVDVYGNIVPGYRRTVHFSSSDAAATLPGNYSFTNGVLTFTATLRTAGTQSLSVTDTLSPSISGSQPGIRVIPLASVAGPSAGIRNQTLTFTLGATGMPAGTVFSYAIDWNGDGNTDQTVSGPSGATVDHAYAASGSYNIGVTATVHIGTQDYVSNKVYKYVTVSAASVSIQTDPADATKKALLVEGTASVDALVLSPGTGNSIAVSINGASVGTFAAPSGLAFAHLLVYGYGGNDTLQLSGGLSVPAFLFGGDGNDTLDPGGSNANNVLVGGANTDALNGGKGRGLLIGGLGADTLRASGGDDILIGAYTDFDANLTALCLLMKEWGRTDADYSTRVKHLSGTLGGGLNGSYLLSVKTVHTVYDDAAIGNLFGDAGMDWYFARTSGNYKDKVNNKSAGEVVTALS